MTVTFDSLEVISATDRARISRTEIATRTQVIQPLRSTSALPAHRGGVRLRYTIEAVRLHATREAAETYMGGLEATIRPKVGFGGNKPLVISTRSTHAAASLDGLTIDDLGLSTKTTWQFTASAS